MTRRDVRIAAYLAGFGATGAALWLTGNHSYLLFHTLTELFGIIVAAAMFTVAWNSRRFSTNGYLTYLGIAYLAVAALDLVHTLAYRGMGVFAGQGADLPTQLWIAGRIVESGSFVIAPLFLARRLRVWPTLLAYLAVTAALLTLIVVLQVFPTCYVDEGPYPGLTTFKIVAEYVICAVLLVGLAALWTARRRFSPDVLALIVWAIALSVLSELAFTRYVSVYGDFNRIGHLLKLASFVLLYKATIESGLRNPYEVLFRDLQQQEQAVRASEQRYRSLLEVAPDALFVTREDRIEFANPAALRLFGTSAAEAILGRSPFDLFHPDSHRTMRDHLRLVLEGTPVPLAEARLVRLDGTFRDVEAAAAAFDDAEGRAIQVMLHDITERKEAARTLEEANRLKDDFLATLSHELRTPLNAILGWAHVLATTPHLDGATSKRAIETIARNARAQAQLVNDVLDVSRIVAGKLRLEVREVDLRVLVESGIEAVRPSADAKGVRIEAAIPPRVAPVVGDPDRLQQILTNLLSNAVKFTPSGGRVSVSLRQAGPYLEVEVQDTGIGIDASFLPIVFDRFQQADGSTSRQHTGLGLGLAIARHLCELHGGTVSAASEGKDRGATFLVRLPMREGPAAAGAHEIQSSIL